MRGIGRVPQTTKNTSTVGEVKHDKGAEANTLLMIDFGLASAKYSYYNTHPRSTKWHRHHFLTCSVKTCFKTKDTSTQNG